MSHDNVSQGCDSLWLVFLLYNGKKYNIIWYVLKR